MKSLAQFLDSAWIRFHIVCFSFFATGLIMALSATEFGPVAAFVVLLGIYTMLFATISEASWLTVSAVRKVAIYYTKRNEPTNYPKIWPTDSKNV